jgi:hypothetical protein
MTADGRSVTTIEGNQPDPGSVEGVTVRTNTRQFKDCRFVRL